MKFGDIHILDCNCSVECGENQSKPSCMFWLNTGFRSGFIVFLSSFVLEGQDHRQIYYCCVMHNKEKLWTPYQFLYRHWERSYYSLLTIYIFIPTNTGVKRSVRYKSNADNERWFVFKLAGNTARYSFQFNDGVTMKILLMFVFLVSFRYCRCLKRAIPKYSFRKISRILILHHGVGMTTWADISQPMNTSKAVQLHLNAGSCRAHPAVREVSRGGISSTKQMKSIWATMWNTAPTTRAQITPITPMNFYFSQQKTDSTPLRHGHIWQPMWNRMRASLS